MYDKDVLQTFIHLTNFNTKINYKHVKSPITRQYSVYFTPLKYIEAWSRKYLLSQKKTPAGLYGL